MSCQGANQPALGLFEAGEALLGLCQSRTCTSSTRFFHQKRRTVLLAFRRAERWRERADSEVAGIKTNELLDKVQHLNTNGQL